MVTSAPIIGDGAPEPIVTLPYAFGVTDTVDASIASAASLAADPRPLEAHEVDFAAGNDGIGVGWFNVMPSDRPLSLTWEVRRFDNWELVLEPTLITADTLLDVGAMASTQALDETATAPSGNATLIETTALATGISYVVVLTAKVDGAGWQSHYVTNRLVLSPGPPQAGFARAGATYAESAISWVGHEEDVGLAWSVFTDNAASLSHFVACLLPQSDAIVNLTTSHEASAVTDALLEKAACEDAGLSRSHRFSSEAVQFVLGIAGEHPTLSASVTAVSKAGYTTTALTCGLLIDLKSPGRPVVTVPRQHMTTTPDFGSLSFHWSPAVTKWAPIDRYYAGVSRHDIVDEADLAASLFAHPIAPQPFRDMGLNTSVTFNSLWLLEDVTYYAIVVADSAAGTRSVGSTQFVLHSKAPNLRAPFEVATIREPLTNTTGNTTQYDTSVEALVMQGNKLDQVDRNTTGTDPILYDAREYLEDVGWDVDEYDEADNGTDMLFADLEALFERGEEPEGIDTGEGEAVAFQTDVDIDFQSATDVMSVAWSVDSDGDGPPPHEFHVTILKRSGSAQSLDEEVQNGTTVAKGDVRSVTFTGLDLVPGGSYYVNIRAVSITGVYVDLVTDGIVVDTQPPCSGDVTLREDAMSAAPEQEAEEKLAALSTSVSTNAQGSEADMVYFSNASAIGIRWTAVVDPARDRVAANKLCPRVAVVNGSYATPINSTMVLDSLFNGNLTGNFSTFEQDELDTNVTNTTESVPLPDLISPLAGFSYSVDLISESVDRSNWTFVNASLYSNETSVWDGTPAFNGTQVNSSAAVHLDSFVDPVCCLPQLAEEGVVERDAEIVESDMASGHCGVFGSSVGFISGHLMAVGGLDTAVVVSMADGMHRRFRWARNMSAAYYEASAAATGGSPKRPTIHLCVRVATSEHAVVFGGSDVVSVYHADRSAGTMTLKLQLDDRDDLVHLRFQAGSIGKAIAVSVFDSTFSGGDVTRVAIAGTHVVSGEGFVAILAIDDGLETTSVEAYIQPRVQLNTPHDRDFGDVLALHERCAVAWGPVTGVVLSCSLAESGLWARVLVKPPEGEVSVRARCCCPLLLLLSTDLSACASPGPSGCNVTGYCKLCGRCGLH